MLLDTAKMPSLALVPEEDESAPSQAETREPFRDVDWQRLWLSVQGKHWRTLALVPAGAGAPLGLTLDAAVTLARTGMLQFGAQIHVADATELEFADIPDFVQQMRETLDSGPVILALAPLSRSPATVQLVRSCDMALMCVMLRRMQVHEAKTTLETIGREHFFGAVTFV